MIKPGIEEFHNEQQWEPWCDLGAMNLNEFAHPTPTLSLLHQYSALSDIVNDTIFDFYAPREMFTGAKVLEFHGRYERWYTNLPEELQVPAVTTPHVLMLQ